MGNELTRHELRTARQGLAKIEGAPMTTPEEVAAVVSVVAKALNQVISAVEHSLGSARD
jgi:hypothetical protein